MNPPPIRVMVVDDHPLVRRGTSALLAEFDDLEVVGEAANGKEAVVKAEAMKPDVILMDLIMPGMDGIELLSRLRRESDAYVIMLTAKSEETDKIVGLSVGADDYVKRASKLQSAFENVLKKHRQAITDLRNVKSNI